VKHFCEIELDDIIEKVIFPLIQNGGRCERESQAAHDCERGDCFCRKLAGKIAVELNGHEFSATAQQS
jgi:hypothetical protein